MSDIVDRLNSVGIYRRGWSPDAFVSFSHTGGMTDMGSVMKFFNNAVRLSREAADEITRLRAALNTQTEED